MSAANEKAADPGKGRAARDSQHDTASVGTPSAAVKQLLAVARGTASDLGTIRLQQQLTLSQLAALFREAHAQPFPLTFEEYSELHVAARSDKAADEKLKDTKKTAWWNASTFNGDRRIGANLSSTSAIVGDVDQPGTTLERLLAKLNALGIAYITHTSTSHGVGGQPRYRVIIPLARPVTKKQYVVLWAWLSEYLDGMADQGAKDATRASYMPRIPTGALGHEVILHDDAPWFDPANIPAVNASQPVARDDAPVLATITPAELADLKDALRYAPLVAAAEANSFWAEIGYALLSTNLQSEWLQFSARAPNQQNATDAEDWWQAHEGQTPRSDFKHIFNMAIDLGWTPPPQISDASSFPVLATTEGAEPAPVIRIKGGNLPEVHDQALRILKQDLYTQGSALVRIAAASELTDRNDLKLSADQRVITPATEEYIRYQLGRRATILKYDARAEAEVPADFPVSHARNIVQQKGWPALRKLRGIARSPIYRADGSICETPGYDAQSQMVYIPNAHFPPLMPDPSKADAEAALCKLLALVSEYPFKDDAAKSAHVSHMITEAVRAALRTVPMFWYTSPQARIGKTELSGHPGAVAHGSRPGTHTWPATEEELGKSVIAELRGGARSILYDNIPSGSKVRSPVLCSIITTDRVRGRILGLTESLEVENAAVIAASGNNITPTADMAARSIVIRLDGNMTPEEQRKRHFKIKNITQYVADHRVELLMAAFTIVRAHQMSGHVGPTPLPSFEQWSRTVRDALLWLGMADPVDTQDETDDESTNVAAAFELLAPMFAGRAFTAQDILAGMSGLVDVTQTLAGTLQGAGCSDPHDTQKLGYWLRDCRDKIGAGYKLEQIKRNSAYKGAHRWHFRSLAPLTASADADDMGDIL